MNYIIKGPGFYPVPEIPDHWWGPRSLKEAGIEEKEKPVAFQVDPNEVVPLDEDGGSWFVTAPESATHQAIRYAVLGFLRANYTEGSDEYLDQVEALATASVEFGTGWWATGHYEGQFVTDVPAPKQESGWFVR